ncbi:MAG: DUF445 domain-containing protein [Deltaproteobacteria bacterium]|nr:DUF445 domain-containing protein [Deltaproteobacteria bacterium]
MDFYQALLADFRAHLWLYLSMPVVAAVIGYVTKLVAIRMMFEPIEFVGIKPFLGWQGIVPRRAERMASIACDTMTARLISPKEIFGRMDPDRVVQEIEKPLLADVEEITREVMDVYAPKLWEMLPEGIRQAVLKRVKDEAPGIVKQIMADVKANIDSVFDLKSMVVGHLVGQKPLLNRIFRESGREEFKFIARSGIYFGSVIGVVQMVTWMFTHSAIIMPLFGLFTGWFTDWLALKMVFRPREPRRFFGVFSWQGLFLKRRKEVAAEYGGLIAREVITPENIFEEVLKGPLSDRLLVMIQNHVQRMVDQQAGLAKPIVVFAVGTERYREMKRLVVLKTIARLPKTLKHVEPYAADAMDIRNTLVTKLQDMTPAEFEGILRPAFQQDEWILIAVGAALGFLVGEMQVFLMLH